MLAATLTSTVKSLLNFFNKNKPDWPTLPQPDDSTSFFEAIKTISELYWQDTSLNKDIYGFQVQQDARWRKGLTDTEIKEFEKSIGFSFPTPLKTFYKTMNGLTKPGINIYGSSGIPPTFHPVYYSFPDDLKLIKEMIDWVYEENNITKGKIEQENISRIFPITGHRFLLIDVSDNPVLSMHGNDIVYWADNLSKLLARDIFDNIWNVSDFESPPQERTDIKFWLE